MEQVPIGDFAINGGILAHWRHDDTVFEGEGSQLERCEKLNHVIQSTTFARKEDYNLVGNYIYARNGSPTVTHAEGLLCELEEGFETRLFASGMGAASALIETLETGQRISAPTIMYHGVKTWMLRQQTMRSIGLDLFDAADPASLAKAIIPGKTAMVWIETPANPTWDVIDIKAAADAAHAAGAILVVDSTCAPPVISKPLTLGADIVFHSATKYLNGHSDVTAGVLTAREASPRWEQVKQAQIGLGATLGSFEAYLLIRGLRTLFLRVEQSSRNALALAKHFGYRLKEIPVTWINDEHSHVKASAYIEVLLETVRIRWALWMGKYEGS